MSHDTAHIISRADVVTLSPGRYAKQLIEHLGRKLQFTTEHATSTVRLGDATGQIVVGDGVLTLRAFGGDEAAVERVEQVLGSHLERFGQRNGLTVVWRRSSAGGGTDVGEPLA